MKVCHESANRQGEKKIFGLVSFLGVELNVTKAQIRWKSLNLLFLGWYSLCEAQENSEITGISENISRRGTFPHNSLLRFHFSVSLKSRRLKFGGVEYVNASLIGHFVTL